LAQSPEKLSLWVRLAQKGLQELDGCKSGVTIAEGRERGREIVRTLYKGTSVEEIAASFLRYNRLVQQIAWSVLGLAEATPNPLVITDAVGTLRYTRSPDGSPFIRLTPAEGEDLPLLRLTHPVWLNTGTPLDGLHVLVGYSMRFGGALSADLSLTPIRWSAGEWPSEA
jgi:hypothetical protein